MGARPRKAVYVDLDEYGKPIDGTYQEIARRKKEKPSDLSQFHACKIFAGEDMFGKRRQTGYVPYDIYRDMSFDELEDYIRKMKGNVPLHFQLYGGELQGSAARFVPPLKTIYEKQPETDPRVAGVMQENEVLRRQLEEQNAKIEALTKMVKAGPVRGDMADDEPQQPTPPKQKGFFEQFTESLGDAAKQKILSVAPQLVDAVGNLLSLTQTNPAMADQNNNNIPPQNNGATMPQDIPFAQPQAVDPNMQAPGGIDPLVDDEPEKNMNYACGYDSVAIAADVPNSMINLVNDVSWREMAPDAIKQIVEFMRGPMGAAMGVILKQQPVTQSKVG